MPMFEYECNTCGHGFELLVFASTCPACPRCESDDLQKKFSVCAMNAHPNGQIGGDNRGHNVNPFQPGPVCPITERE